jgi:hypothetical protein
MNIFGLLLSALRAGTRVRHDIASNIQALDGLGGWTVGVGWQ